jgi:hypothetical protein
VEADAMGLRSTFCITQPAIASPAPITSAVQTLGSRTFQMMVELFVCPLWKSASKISDTVNPAEPAEIDQSAAMTSNIMVTTIANHFRATYC